MTERTVGHRVDQMAPMLPPKGFTNDCDWPHLSERAREENKLGSSEKTTGETLLFCPSDADFSIWPYQSEEENS